MITKIRDSKQICFAARIRIVQGTLGSLPAIADLKSGPFATAYQKSKPRCRKAESSFQASRAPKRGNPTNELLSKEPGQLDGHESTLCGGSSGCAREWLLSLVPRCVQRLWMRVSVFIGTCAGMRAAVVGARERV